MERGIHRELEDEARNMIPRIHAHDLVRKSGSEAVIFDMDGVLADTEEYHVEAWAALARAHSLYPDGAEPGSPGGEAALKVIRSTFGQTNDTIIPLLWRHAGRGPVDDVAALSREKETSYRTAARGRVRPMTGVERFLRWLRANGVPTAIGTSGPAANVEFLLAEFGWEGLFTSLIHRQRFAAGKPAPDCFLKAAEELRVRPRRAIVFEDSIHGLLAARQGGFWPAAIAGTHTETELLPYSRWVFRDFREVCC